ncbi:BTB-POZ domain and tricorn protease domain 2 containing protein [Megavirus chiliensis]|uniref:BTB POZ domain-containing n=2 Tax=Megamimivirinae TaxID=3044648 RepID=A0A2L2DL94_MIMIV|nr:putative BTB/POZ domain-containing protein [Megavirus chiliensis]AEQ33139.1 BTB-POZ domain and tricorn protease domain 2 containing protein [Megavirus chiliensis]AVG46949.1 BTB POZ domain-containing [Acanthamoeba polyphaga mimivirus]
MLLTKIYLDNKFSDLSITLSNDTDKYIINVNKCILYASSSYFEKMFSDFRESNQSNIIINVDNIEAAKIVIESIYDIPIPQNIDWLLQIDIYKYFDYFCIPHQLPDIHINSNDFDIFLDKIDCLGYPDNIVQCIINNLPLNYDISQFPTELLKSIYNLCQANNILFHTGEIFFIQNLKNNNLTQIHSLKSDNYFVEFEYIPDNGQIFIMENDKNCEKVSQMYIINENVESKQITNINLDYFIPLGIKYLSDNEILLHCDQKLIKYNLQTKEKDNFFDNDHDIQKSCFDTDLIHTVIGQWNCIQIYDNLTKNLINQLEHYQTIDLCISSQIHCVIIQTSKKIKIWDYSANKIKTIYDKKYIQCDIKFSPDNKHILISNYNSVFIYNTVTYQFKKEIILTKKSSFDKTKMDFLIGGELIICKGNFMYIYDKEFKELINKIETHVYIYNFKVIPGKDYHLAKKIIGLLEIKI